MHDRYLQFSDGQDITLTAGNGVVSTDIHQVITGKNAFGTTKYASPGENQQMRVVITAATDLVPVSGAVVTYALYTHSTTTVNSGTLLDSVTKTYTTTQSAGTVLAELNFPVGNLATEYVGLYYSTATQNITSGTVDAALFEFTIKPVTSS